MSRPVRSLLAWLGLTVAIAGMVGLFSVAAGLEATVERTFDRIPGVVAMQPGTAIPFFSKLPRTWADEIAAMPGVRRTTREVWARANLVEGVPTFYPPRFVFGADIVNMLDLRAAVYRDDIVAGRFLKVADIGLPRCVISKQLADEYKLEIGMPIRVDGAELEIVGLYETRSMLLDMAILTSDVVARKMAHIEDDIVSSIYIEPDGSLPETELIEQIRSHFRGRTREFPRANVGLAQSTLSRLTAGFAGGQPAPGAAAMPATPAEAVIAANSEAIEVHSTSEWGDRIQQFGGEIDIYLILMNTIGVLIALLSILNTMLMSVTERMTEFGILRANGWSSRNVMSLILAESTVLGVGGGIFGCLFGYIGTLIMNWQFGARLTMYASPMVLLFSLVFSIVLGVVGGLYPAWWSVRRSPMDAIRRG